MMRAVTLCLAAAGSVAATNGASVMFENQSIGVPAAIGIAATVLTAGLYLERRFNSRDLAAALRDKKLEGRLTHIEDAISDLACVREKNRGAAFHCPNKETPV